MLDIYFIYFDKLQQKLFYNCKELEKYGIFSKTIQPFPFGDQQLTETLIYRHKYTVFHLSNTINYGNGLSHRVDKQSLYIAPELNFRKNTKLILMFVWV